MIDLGALILSLAMLVAATFARPRHARCPHGWWLNGVRSSGLFGCRPTPASETDNPPDVEFEGRVYCTGGMRPVVVDAQVVGCQREGY